jgi:N-methylhydantoinase A/oxoprolinase/acetone carboxylase beta subunit
MSLRIGCDVGGTFTDFIFVNPDNGAVTTGKVLTTSADPSEAILAGTHSYAAETQSDIAVAEQIVHGTTLGINALLERRGAKTGLLVTHGFRDILDIRRCNRVDMYELKGSFPAPLIARELRREIHERIYSDGTVLQPLDEDQVRNEIRALLRDGVEAIVICTLHAYVNPSHELRIAELVREEAPDVFVSLSHQVAGEIKEFERLSTAAIDAYIKPKMQQYLARLQDGLKKQGFPGDMYLMLSGGSVVAAKTGARMPARLVESGPIAGALAARHFAGKLGVRDIVSYDMGGTSAKACFIREGDIPITREYEIDRSYRFKRGTGMPLSVPTVDLIEIGAGGGSIARINELGLLKVGPTSAGASPGPACYGRGGELPTVTDADLVLGFLDADYFAGGRVKLDISASKKALQKHIAEPLGIDTLKAAWGIHKVVNESMANALKTSVAESGGDIHRITMVGFGGAGPLHAIQLARSLKIPQVLIPPCAGVASALGFLLAPLAYDLVRTYKVELSRLDVSHLEKLIQDMETEGAQIVAEAGSRRPLVTRRFAELCFVGQGYPVMINLPASGQRGIDIDSLRRGFFDAYRQRYGHCSETFPVELVSLRVTVGTEPAEMPPFNATPKSGSASQSLKGRRDAFDGVSESMIPYEVHDRYLLTAGDTIAGPALIEERETTTVLPVGATLTVQDDSSLLVKLASGAH